MLHALYSSRSFMCDVWKIKGLQAHRRQGKTKRLQLKDSEVLQLTGRRLPTVQDHLSCATRLCFYQKHILSSTFYKCFSSQNGKK